MFIHQLGEWKNWLFRENFFVVIDEMTKILDHFGRKLEQQKEYSSNGIRQLEYFLTTTLDELKQYIHHAIIAYTEKEQVEMLQNKIETLNEENNKLKHGKSEKKIFINSLAGKLDEERARKMWHREFWKTRKVQSQQNVLLETRDRFSPFQNTQHEMLDKKSEKL